MSIIYSTAISREIRSAFVIYMEAREKADKVKINAAFCAFADACEKENKLLMSVYEQLVSELK